MSRSTAASGLRRRSYRGHVGLLLAPAASPRVISLQPIKSEETMLELYHNIISTCSQKVRLCFAEKGLTYVDRHIEFSERGHLSPEYLKLNPNGVVPTLVHDGNPVIDSSVILEYLDEAFPETSLPPANLVERARMRAWLRYFEEVPTVAVSFPSFNHGFLKLSCALPSEQVPPEPRL